MGPIQSADIMETHTAFFYGTLMAEPVLYRVLFGTTNPDPYQRESLRVRSGLVRGYCRHRVKYADYPAIIPQEGESVRGTIVSGLISMHLKRLDTFEGSEYERIILDPSALGEIAPQTGDSSLVTVSQASAADDIGEVQTYVWKGRQDELEREEWDFEHFRREKMKAWAGDREEYDEIADEEAKGTYGDPMRGRGVDGVIGKELREAGIEDHDSVRAAA